MQNLKITGVILGKVRSAIAEIGKETFTLKEGSPIGNSNATVKAILPGGIVVVEKIRNVYNQDEYIETIVPIF